jgi:hypothetical protein
MRYGIGILLLSNLAGIHAVVTYRRVPRRHGTECSREVAFDIRAEANAVAVGGERQPTRSLTGTFAFETRQVTREVSETWMDREGDR